MKILADFLSLSGSGEYRVADYGYLFLFHTSVLGEKNGVSVVRRDVDVVLEVDEEKKQVVVRAGESEPGFYFFVHEDEEILEGQIEEVLNLPSIYVKLVKCLGSQVTVRDVEGSFYIVALNSKGEVEQTWID